MRGQLQRYLPTAVVLGALASVAACSGASDRFAGLPDVIDYNWHVRPILSENCFQCHGNDPESVEAGLRLNAPETALAELRDWSDHYAIVPGEPDASELIRRITEPSEEDRMPPVSTHKSLSALEIEILRQWIADGAEYKRHWAFITPTRPSVPEPDAIAAAASGIPVVRPPIAGVPLRPRTQVDAFVLRRLVQAGLAPSAEADRETLISRVSLTLTGLPPTLAEVDAFVADDSVDAYERLVDRLIASPRYAEHMAAFWMDLARYSETDGFLDDHHDRTFWPYRDWVIDAFANNMPFDQFGTWQLAGDLLPDATRDQLLATAYVRLGKRTTENGSIDEEYKAEYMVERTDNALGVAFLGLTVGCARCHDHRYDPISQRDYYSLGAFFNSTDEPGTYAPGHSAIQHGPTLAWPDDEAGRKIDAAAAELTAAEADYATAVALARDRLQGAADELAAMPDELAGRLQASIGARLAAYYPLDSASPASLEELPLPLQRHDPPYDLVDLDYKAFVGQPGEPEQVRFAREAASLRNRVPRNYIAEELTLSPAAGPSVPDAVLQAPILRNGVVGNAMFFDETNRGFLGRDVGWYDRTNPFSLDFWFYAAEAYDRVPVINHRDERNSGEAGYTLRIVDGHLWFQIAHAPPANMIAMRSVEPFPVGEWTHISISYDGSSSAAGTHIYLDGRLIDVEIDHDSLTRSSLPQGYAEVFDPFVGLAFGIRFREKAPVGSGIDEIRVFDGALTPLEVAFLHDGEAALAGEGAAGRAVVADFIVANDQRVVESLAHLTSARRAHNALVTVVPQVLVMGDAPEPRPTYVLQRGVYSSPGEQVEARGLESAFPWDESLPPNRLGLAQWLFDPAHPLTARVFVNRLWQMHFGRGLVETAEDFGSQGSIPSHPDLLDWLAVEFVESGWDIKALHKRIVMSATYRQNSNLDAVLAAADPRNALLARGPRWRMTAEMVRDHALAVSGLLTDEIGGRSVMPYQASGIWNPLNSFYAYPAPDSLPADAHHRRTLYTFVKRNALHPTLEIFDFKARTESVARRRSSSTPLQALVLMNDPQYAEAYRRLAERILGASVSGDGATTASEDLLVSVFRTVTRRTPSAAERDVLASYHAEQLALFEGDPQKAARLLSIGVTPPDSGLDAVPLAALTQVAGLVMNSPDAFTVR